MGGGWCLCGSDMHGLFSFHISFYPSKSAATSVLADSSILDRYRLQYVVTHLSHKDTSLLCSMEELAFDPI